jgi:Cu(I)/Ag(I) efflux system membrane fusion protein
MSTEITLKKTFLVLLITSAALIGGIASNTLFSETTMNMAETETDSEIDNEPMYWVAPMDANYRRDQPGKSPMGMDLVPVYAQSKTLEVGTVKISPAVENNIAVRTAKVKLGMLASQIKTIGYVGYDQGKLVHIHPRVEGWIEELAVKSVGDPVTKGQVIYELYSPELVNAQEEYILALSRKNDRLIIAAENRLMALHLPKSAIRQLKITRQVEQNIKFYAPQSGVVENLAIREGFFVKPGATLFSIGDLSEVWVEAEIFERQASFVSEGNAVTMTLDYLAGKTWHGKVDYIYPTLDVKTRTMRVRLRFDNPNLALKPNMFAQVIIEGNATNKSLLVNKEAVIRTGNQDRVVLALGEGKFKSVEVKLGRSDQKYFEIIEGLNDGDTIVVSAQFLLDSESSKTSDFKRMSVFEDSNNTTSPSENLDDEMSMEMKSLPSARVKGRINRIDVDNRLLNISRDAIEKWQRPAATLDFSLDASINIDTLSPESDIDFTFDINNGEFIVTHIHHEGM